ncbi:cellulase family glycosylhydrolase [Bradyrhizobium commune]|uniref:Cellulase family glycosylhydrolase n=1 Tax=Bradyrhizobium commune TaxID=83627 RepID=A0A7S9GY91_9BRAD|nr:cellulase family glycosylhydrolase [Bradyrhizobium commune]QPF90253.1 cellulase family glycosylhydrolase [Bradyrhizobium commune]
MAGVTGALAMLLFCSVSWSSPVQKGMNAGDLLFMSPTQLRARFADMQVTGVKWLRVEFDWSRIQPNDQDNYALEQHDRIVNLAEEFDISVLGLIYFCPAWANGGHKPPASPPADPRDFGRFASVLAARYSAAGLHHWEIWNEPNLGISWGPSPSPTEYVALLKAAYVAIKKVDSSATVVSGGLAQPYNTSTTMRAADFLDAIYRNGAKEFLDAVGNHPYGNWEKMDGPNGLRSIMSKYNDQDKDIWVTEYGAPTDGKGSVVVSESAQAALLKDAFDRSTTQSKLGPIFWYNYKDWCPKGKDDPDCYYGLLRFDDSRKLSYLQFMEIH